MITICNKQTGQTIGEITADDLRFLQDLMVEDRSDDHDYYINDTELIVFEESGATPELVNLLRKSLDENGELEIEWDGE